MAAECKVCGTRMLVQSAATFCSEGCRSYFARAAAEAKGVPVDEHGHPATCPPIPARLDCCGSEPMQISTVVGTQKPLVARPQGRWGWRVWCPRHAWQPIG